MKRTMIAPIILLAFPVLAQESASYRLSEHTINSGGHPTAGTVLASASFRVTLDSIGDGVVGPAMQSGSFRMDSGFPGRYPPPGEVHELSFSDSETLAWSPDRSIGSYVLYGGAVDDLAVADYGICLQEEIETESTTVSDVPPSGMSQFYLVTAVNRLGEEGTAGYDFGGTERPHGAPCP